MSYRVGRQVIDTHTLTDTQTGAMTIPEGQNWPRVKSSLLQPRVAYLISPKKMTSQGHIQTP